MKKIVEVIEPNPSLIENKLKNRSGKLKVAAYARVSTTKEEQLTSYNSQVSYYTDLIMKNPEWELVKIYTDKGLSGTQIKKRKGYQEMLRDALNGKIDLILVKSISRFNRNTVQLLNTIRTLKEKGVAVLFEEGNINTLTMQGEVLITVLASLAQDGSTTISSGVKRGILMKMKRGEMVGRYDSYGFDYDKDTKELKINRKKANVGLFIYYLYIEKKLGGRRIAKILTSLGIPTPKGKSVWQENSVLYIIKNEKNCGHLTLGKTYVQDTITHTRKINMGESLKVTVEESHNGWLETDVYKEAQNLRLIRAPQDQIGKRKSPSTLYPFSSKIFCPVCGHHYIRKTWINKKTGEKNFVWICSGKAKGICKGCFNLKEKDLESYFVNILNQMKLNYNAVLPELLETIKITINKSENELNLQNVKNEKDTLQISRKKLLDGYLNNIIDDKMYKQKDLEIEKELQEVESEIVRIENIVENKELLNQRVEKFKSILSNFSKIDSFDEEIFDAFVRRIELELIDGMRKVIFVLKDGVTVDNILQKKTVSTSFDIDESESALFSNKPSYDEVEEY